MCSDECGACVLRNTDSSDECGACVLRNRELSYEDEILLNDDLSESSLAYAVPHDS